jgi:hypothetical protein
MNKLYYEPESSTTCECIYVTDYYKLLSSSFPYGKDFIYKDFMYLFKYNLKFCMFATVDL